MKNRIKMFIVLILINKKYLSGSTEYLFYSLYLLTIGLEIFAILVAK